VNESTPDPALPSWALDPPTLVGGTVVLRPLEPGDLDAIEATATDPEFVRWTTVPVPYARGDAEAFVAMFGRDGERWRSGRGAGWAICDPADRGAYWGAIDLRLDGCGGAEVGYGVSPWARGRGAGTAALLLACRWGFEQAGLRRIEWLAHVGNDASRRVAEKAGFHVLDGALRRRCNSRGEWYDAWVGDLLPEDLGPPRRPRAP
jgi:RimJ/RimL family protein N-acetyltransferase